MHTAASLRAALAGRVLLPGDAGWDRARQAFNLTVDQRPRAVVVPAGEPDVVAAVQHASRHGLRIAPQLTGHGAGALGPLDDVVLMRLSELAEVTIDPDARRVRVGAGVTWKRVVDRLSEHGLAALHGSSPTVGVAGYSLSGGMGWLARRYGLQAGSVTAIEAVTADGQLVRADAGHEPHLFWALRGGGGSFAVVTAIEFAVHPVAELYAGALFFELERAGEVLHAWTGQLSDFPDELTSWASLLRLPDAAHVPAELRGGSFAVVSGAFLGGAADGSRLLDPLRRLRPRLDTFAPVAPAALGDLAMDPPRPVPYASVHRLLGELPPDGVDALVAAAGPGSGSALTKVQLRHTGGALARPRPGAGALSGLPGRLSAFGLGVVADAAAETAVRASLETLDAALRPHRVGEYPAFVEDPADAGRFFEPPTRARLREVKALYDPDDVFTGAHAVEPGEPDARSHVPARERPAALAGTTVASPPAAVARPLEAFRWSPEVALVEGRWDGIEASLYVTTFAAGGGPRLHRHPYPELFLVQDGQARFHVGDEHRDVAAGHVVVVAAETPHRYENIGRDPLTVISVQPSGVVVQTNLDDAQDGGAGPAQAAAAPAPWACTSPTNVRTTSASNCVPAQRSSSASATSALRACA